MWWLLSPLSWLLLAICLAGGSVWMRSRALAVVSGLLAALAVMAMTPVFANFLIARLEAPVEQGKDCLHEPPVVAVVLGGGMDRMPRDSQDISVLSMISRRRIEHAVVWWKQTPGRRLLMSGGPLSPGEPAEAGLSARYAADRGVPISAMGVESQSRSTWENARYTRALGDVPRRVVLVTSAIHMPRAVYSMRRAGFSVCPLPTESERTEFSLPGYLIPQAAAATKTQAALHEVVGLIYYRWLNYRSSAATAD